MHKLRLERGLICLCAIMVVSGCASVSSRVGANRGANPGIYPGIQVEAERLDTALHQDHDPLMEFGRDGIEFLGTPFILLDYVATIAVDTVLIPADMIWNKESRAD